MSEVWKDIPGYEGLYQASNMGQVRSLPRVVRKKNGTSQFKDGAIKTPTKTKNGYHHMLLYDVDGKAKSWLVHRLIAVTFLGAEPERGRNYVRHLDGDRVNNRPDNLAYGTAKENMADQLSYMRPGDNLRGWKLREEDVREIKSRIGKGETNTEICKTYAVSDVVISNIRLGRTYKWVV